MKKVLITGATGFIGSHTIPLLVESGYEVHAVFHQAHPLFKQNHPVSWHQCDLLDTNQQNVLVKDLKPTHLLHFAWYLVPKSYWTSLENIRWLRASLELLENFADQGGKRAVLAGTCAEYDWNYGYCSEELTPTRPASLYGTCKKGLQEILQYFSEVTGVSTVWGRIFYLYGPREHSSRLIPTVIRSLLNDKPARCSYGGQIRDYLYVEDVASAFVALLKNDVQGIFNIGSGKPVEVKTIVNWLANRLGHPELVKFDSVPASDDEPPFLVAMVKRLKEEVGWEQKFTLEVGLEATIAWWLRK